MCGKAENYQLSTVNLYTIYVAIPVQCTLCNVQVDFNAVGHGRANVDGQHVTDGLRRGVISETRLRGVSFAAERRVDSRQSAL